MKLVPQISYFVYQHGLGVQKECTAISIPKKTRIRRYQTRGSDPCEKQFLNSDEVRLVCLHAIQKLAWKKMNMRKKQKSLISTTSPPSQSQPLIPGLPDNLAALCLARVPLTEHLNMRSVSRSWREFLHSEDCYWSREESGVVDFEEEWLHDFVVSEVIEAAVNVSLEELARPWKHTTFQKVLEMCRFNLSTHEWEIWIHAGNVYKISGLSRVKGKVTSVMLKYNDHSRKWLPCASMLVPRHSYAYGAIHSNGPIYVVGGYGGKDGTERLTSAEMYSPWTDTWDFIPAYIPLRA